MNRRSEGARCSPECSGQSIGCVVLENDNLLGENVDAFGRAATLVPCMRVFLTVHGFNRQSILKRREAKLESGLVSGGMLEVAAPSSGMVAHIHACSSRMA